VKANLKSRAGAVLIGCVIALACGNIFGLGSDHPDGQPVTASNWPDGMASLVNGTNRIHGFFVNDVDVFFFAGTATNFSSFLEDYSKIGGTVDRHRLILHEGAGDAKSPWGKNGLPCDWELYGQGNGWKNGIMTNYLLEVHFWTGGKIILNQVTIPKNVELAGECFKNFESITNGMTRAEVEKKLTMDGGLQTVSPVRFLDPACPGFKINVEFDFKRNAIDQNRAIETKADKVIRVSKPYLERPFMD
jgi:hypothetical protein